MKTLPRPLKDQLFGSVAALALFAMWGIAPATGQIVPDGRSATTIGHTGAHADVHTSTISGGFGVNSFTQFSTHAGSSVHLHAPAGTVGTVNLVSGRAEIGGTVAGIHNGAVGGAVYIAGSGGVVVGPGGAIHADSIGLSTPTQGFINGAFDASGQVVSGHIAQILNGTAPQSTAGLSIAGTLHATDRVILRTGGDLVLHSQARITAQGRSGAGGTIGIRTGGDVLVEQGAAIVAEGTGYAGGGIIHIFADGSARLRRDAVISAAALGAGDGGFVEFSARETVQVQGMLAAHSAGGGAGGMIYIDPEDFEVEENVFTHGATYLVEVSRDIIVHEGVTISTRNLAFGSAANHATTNSAVGASGDLILIGPNITLRDGVQLLAQDGSGCGGGPGGCAAGDIIVIARDPFDTGLNPVGSRSLTVDSVYMFGGNIQLGAEVHKNSGILDASARADYLNNYVLTVATGATPRPADITNVLLFEAVGQGANALIDATGAAVFPASATATIDITNSTLRARGSIAIAAEASARVAMDGLRVAYASASAEAHVRVTDTLLRADAAVGSEAVRITAHAETDLQIEAGAFVLGTNNTHASVVVTDSEVQQPRRADVTIRADTVERAHLDGQDEFSAVISLRDQSAEAVWHLSTTELDFARPGKGNIWGGVLRVDATSTRDTVLTGAGGSAGPSGVLLRSVADGATRVRFAGATDVTRAVLNAATTQSYRAEAVAGSPAMPPRGTAPAGIDPTAWASAAAQAAADGAADAGAPDAAILGAAALGFVQISERHTEDTRTTIGGEGDDGSVPGALGTDALAGFGPVTLRATNTITDLTKIARLAMPDGTSALAVNLTRGTWDLGARVHFTHNSSLGATRLTIEAENALPTKGSAGVIALRDLTDNVGAGIATDASATLDAADLMPDVTKGFAAADWAITTETSAGNGANGAIDTGRHSFTLTAEALVDDETNLGNLNRLELSAVNRGVVLQRRIAPAVADGLGGTHRVLDLTPVARAVLGRGASDFVGDAESGGQSTISADQITIAAHNALGAGLFTSAFSAGGPAAIAGALSRINYDSVSQALMDGRQEIYSSVVTISARDTTTLAAGAGVGTSAQTGGVGGSHALIVANRDVLAALSDNLDGTIGANTTGWGYAFHDIDELAINAETAAVDIVTAVAGSGAAGSTPQIGGDGPDGFDMAGLTAVDGLAIMSSGVAASGDYAGLRQTNRTRAIHESDAFIYSKALNLSARDDSRALLGSGAALEGAGALGLGGSLASLVQQTDTRALLLGQGGLQPRGIDEGAILSVTARNTGKARVLAAGRAGDKFALNVMGSAAKADVTARVEARVDRQHDEWTTTALSLGATVLAEGAASVWAIAGGVQRSGGDDDDDESAPDSSNGASVGFAAARLSVSEVVLAEAANLRLRDLAADFPVTIAAISNGDHVGAAMSLGGSGNWALTHSDVRITTEQTTRARARNLETVMGQGELAVLAVDGSSVRARVGSEGDADKAGWGSSEVTLTDTRVTQAQASDLQMRSLVFLAPLALRVEAANTATLDLFQQAGNGDGGNVALGFAAGRLEASWQTLAQVQGSDIATRDVTVSAREKADLRNRQGGVQSATSFAGAVGAVVSTIDADIAARISDSTITADSVELSAKSLSAMRSRAVLSGDVSAGSNAQAVIAKQERRGTTRAEVDDSVITADLGLTALDATWREIVSNAAASASGIGAAGALAVDIYQHDTRARVLGGQLFGSAVRIEALSDTRLSGISLARAKTGAATSLLMQAIWSKDDRDVLAEITSAEMDLSGDVFVNAARTDAALMLSATENGGTTGAGLGMNVLLTGGATRATVTGATVSVGGDLQITARDETRALSLALGTGSSGQFGAVGSLAIIQAGRLDDDATRLQDDPRDAEHRAQAAATRDAVADAADPALGLGAAGARDVREQTLVAQLSVADGGLVDVGGDLTLHAQDLRVASAIAGQLQAGFLSRVSGVLDSFTTQVQVTSITATGFQIDFGKIRLSGEDGTGRLEIDNRRRTGWDLDEGDPAFDIAIGGDAPPDDPTLSDLIDAATVARDKIRDLRKVEWDGLFDDNRPGTHGGGSGDLAEVADKMDGPPDLDTGLGLGLALSLVEFGGRTEAQVTLGAGSAVTVASATQLDAMSGIVGLSVSAGAQIGTGTVIGAGGALQGHKQVTRATITGSGQIVSDEIALAAQSDGQATTFAGLVTAGGRSAGGATVAATRLDAQTEAVVDGATLTARAGDIVQVAQDLTAAGTRAVGGGGSASGGYLGGSLASTAVRSHVSALARNASLTASGDIAIRATRTPEIVSLTLQAGASGAGVAGTGALGIVRMAGTTEAQMIDTTALAGDDIEVQAAASVEMGAAAVSLAVATGSALSGSASIVKRDDTVSATISGGTAHAADSVLVQALASGVLDGLGGGDGNLLGHLRNESLNFNFGGTAGLGVSVPVIDSRVSVIADITRGAQVTADGTLAQDGVQARSRSAATEYREAQDATRHGIAVIADNTTTLRTLALTLGGGGTTSIQAQVPVLIVRDLVEAGARVESGLARVALTAARDVRIEAANDSDLKTFVLTGSVGGTTAAGADIEYLELVKTTRALIDRADIAARDITLRAAAPERVTTTSVSGALGGLSALGGIVQVVRSTGQTSALVTGATLTASRDLRILANAPRAIVQSAGNLNLAGGAASIGASIVVLNVEDIVRAEVTDSPTAIAPAFTTALDVARDVTIDARSDFTHSGIVLGLSGASGVGINASILVSQFRQTVRAWLGAHATMFVGRTRDLTVTATQTIAQNTIVGGLAGGGIGGIGASVAAVSARNTVAAGIGADARVDVTGDVTVDASTTRDVTGVAASLGGGGVLSVQGSVLVITFGKPAEVDEPREALDLVAADLGGDPYRANGQGFGGGDAEVAAALSAARAGRAATDVGALTRLAGLPEDSVTATIGARAQVSALGTITVAAREQGQIDAISGAVGGAGVLSATGGVTVVNRGSTLRTTIGSSAVLTGASVRLEALADVDQDQTLEPTAIAGSAAGLLGLSGAVAVSTTARSMAIEIGGETRIETAATGRIEMHVTERGGTRANAGALALAGGVGVGGTWAAARHDSALAITFGTAPRIELAGGTVDLRISRSGEVKSFATAAAGGVLGSIAGSLAQSDDTARATINLGAVLINNAPGVNAAQHRDTSIAIFNGSTVRATSNGVALAGIASGGASIAEARRDARATITGDAAQFITRNLTIGAYDSTSAASDSLVRARSVTVAASLLVSATAGVGLAQNTSRSEIDLALVGASLVRGAMTMTARSRGEVDSQSTGVTASAIAIGANASTAGSYTTSRALLDVTGAALVVGGALTVEGATVETVTNRAISGTGGLGIVQAARADLNASATIEVGLVGSGLIMADAVTVRADRDATLDNRANSLAASVAGAGGTKVVTDIGGVIDVTVDTVITAGAFDIAARNAVARREQGFTGTLGDVGLYSGISLDARTQFDTATRILFTNRALLTQTDATRAIAVRIDEDVDLDEAVKIDSVGAIRRPHARSEVIAATTARILFDGARVLAQGDIAVTNDADVSIAATTIVNVGGLAGAPAGFSTARFTETRETALSGAALLESKRGSIALGAGNAERPVAVGSETRIWNGVALGSGFTDTEKTVLVSNAQGGFDQVTLAPNIGADARIVQGVTVSVGGGSELRAARDIALTAMRGARDAYAFGAGSSVWRDMTGQAANFIRGLVGAEDVSADFVTGTSSAGGRGDVVVDGTVTAGAFAQQLLQINRAGEITRRVGEEIDVTFVENADIAALVDAYIAEVSAAPAGDAEFETVRAFELNRLALLRDAMSAHDDVTVLVIEDLFAAGGNVIVEADVLRGTGAITADGDARIEVFSDAAAIIDLRSALIPFEAGGDIRMNGVSVLSNAQIQDLNDAGSIMLLSNMPPVFGPDPAARAQFTLDRSAADGPRPVIRVHNTYVGSGGWSGDLFVTGTVENLRGTVELATADGNILVLGGTIEAGAINIFSGGDFFLGASIGEPLVNLGSDPRGGPHTGLYGDFFNDMEGWFESGANIAARPAFTYREGDGQLRAGGSIFVYADAVNINGLVQAGIADWSLSIASGIEALIDAAGLSATEQTVLFSRGYAIDEVNPNLPGFASPVPGITGNGIVRWDPVARVLRIDPMITRGGLVEIAGRIVSTGGGRIEAAHGFGRINITNDSTLPIVLSDLSTGTGAGAEGLIRIIDTAKPMGDGFVVTTYRQRADGQVEASFTNSGQLLGTAPSGVALPAPTVWIPQGTNATYDIVPNTAIRYGTGETETYLTVIVEERIVNLTNGALLGPIVVSSNTSSTVGARNTTEITTSVAAGLAGYAFASDFTGPEPVSTNAGSWTRVSDETRQANLGDPQLELQTRAILVTEREHRHFDHLLKADYPVSIGFAGYESGEIVIDSRGTVSLTGSVINRSGPTSIRAVNPAAGADPLGASIFMRRDPVMQVARLRLEADNYIVGGAPGQNVALTQTPILIDQVPGRGLELRAGGDIRVQSMGNMVLREVVSSRNVPGLSSAVRGNVTLRAAGAILVSANAVEGAVVEGSNITLVARSGTIGTEDTPLRIASVGGTLTARAGFDIDITSPDATIRILQVESLAGDVTLHSGLSILDANQVVLEDRRERDGTLSALWDSIGLRATDTLTDGSANTRDTDALARLVAARTQAYRSYWATRGDAPYDPNAVLELSAAEMASLNAQGLSPDDQTALVAGRTQAYHAAHALFGSGSFDREFVYVPTVEDINLIGDSIFLSDAFLGLGLRADLVLEATDTQGVIEAPNIIARNVTLSAGGSIGSEVETAPITRGSALTPDLLERLWTAERADFRFIDDDTLIVRRLEDVDIIARGELDVIAGRFVSGLPQEGDIFISSPEALTLRRAAALRDLRIKAAEGLVAAGAPGTIAGVVGHNIVLEGGSGGVGSSSVPLSVVQSATGSFAARALGDLALLAPAGNLDIREVFSGVGVATIVAAAGSIRDGNDDDTADIIARQIVLSANQTIGAATNKLDIDPRGAVRLVSAGSVQGGTFLNVTGGNAVALAVGSVQAETHLSVSEGDLLLFGTPGLQAINAGTDLVLSVSGNVIGKPGQQVDIVASGAVQLNLGGDFGRADQPVVTAFDTAVLSAFATAGNIAPQVFISNTGDMALGLVGLGNAGSRLALQTTGDLTLGAMPVFTASTVELGTRNPAGSFGQIQIDGTVSHIGQSLTLHSATTIAFAPDARVDTTGTLGVVASAILGQGGSVSAGADLSVTASSLGGITFAGVQAGGDLIVQSGGLSRLGTVVARTADIRAHTITGDYSVAERLVLDAALFLGGGDENGLTEAVVIRAQPDLNDVVLTGDYGVNVRFEGTPTRFAQSVHSVRTQTVATGLLRRLDGTTQAIEDSYGANAGDLESLGITLSGGAYLTIAGDGLHANGAPISVDTARLTQLAGASVTSGGGAISLRDRGFGVPMVLGAMIDSGGGVIEIAARSGLETAAVIQSFGGDIHVSTELTAPSSTAPVRLSNITTMGGNLTVDIAEGTDLDAGLSVFNAGAGRIAITAGGDAILQGRLLSTYDDGDAAISLHVAGRLVTDQGIPRLDTAIQAANGLVEVRAQSLGATAQRPLVLATALLDLSVAEGPVHVLGAGSLGLRRVVSQDGSLIDIFVDGDLRGAGSVVTQAEDGTRGDIVLTASGSIGGVFTQIVGRFVQMTALEGTLGFSPLAIRAAEVTRWRLYARDGIEVDIDSELRAGWVVSQGAVIMSADGPVEIALLGTPEEPQITAPSVVVDAHGASQPVNLLPPVDGGVVNAARYSWVPVSAPSQGGGGDTGGGSGDGGSGTGDSGTGDSGTGGTGGGVGPGPGLGGISGPRPGPARPILGPSRGPRAGFTPPGIQGGFLPLAGGQAGNGGASFLFTPPPFDGDDDDEDDDA